MPSHDSGLIPARYHTFDSCTILLSRPLLMLSIRKHGPVPTRLRWNWTKDQAGRDARLRYLVLRLEDGFRTFYENGHFLVATHTHDSRMSTAPRQQFVSARAVRAAAWSHQTAANHRFVPRLKKEELQEESLRRFVANETKYCFVTERTDFLSGTDVTPT